MSATCRFACVSLVSLAIAWGQSSSSAILGLVTDSSGAVVPGAAVAATHTDTNQSYQTVTTGDGYFQIPSVPVGAYTLTVNYAGFKRSVRSGLVVQVDEKLRVD